MRTILGGDYETCFGNGMVVGAVCSLARSGHAGPIVNQTFSGLFPETIAGTPPNRGTALEEAFTLASITNLTITTTSYAKGGFEPNLLPRHVFCDRVAW